MRKLVYRMMSESNVLQNSLCFHYLMNIINHQCDDRLHCLLHEVEMDTNIEEFQVIQYLLPC